MRRHLLSVGLLAILFQLNEIPQNNDPEQEQGMTIFLTFKDATRKCHPEN